MESIKEIRDTGLTLRQDMFARAYAIHPNGTEAAVSAGARNRNTAAVAASNFIRNPKIIGRIDHYREKLFEDSGLTPKFVVDGLMQEARGLQDSTPAARVTAYRTLGSYLGLESEANKEVAASNTEDMDLDALEARLGALKSERAAQAKVVYGIDEEKMTHQSSAEDDFLGI